MTSLPSEPCPGCAEGWRLVGDLYCAECYSGQIEQLRKALGEIANGTCDAAPPYRALGRDQMRQIAHDALGRVGWSLSSTHQTTEAK